MVSMKEWKKRAQAAGATTKEIMQALESNSLPALVLEYETVIAPQKAAEEARNPSLHLLFFVLQCLGLCC